MSVSDRTGRLHSSVRSLESADAPHRGALVRSAAQLVFALYSGIPIDAIRVRSGEVTLSFRRDRALTGDAAAREYYQMILAGGIAERRLEGSDSGDVEADLNQIEEIHTLLHPEQAGLPSAFDSMIARCRRRVLFHLADPKIRDSIQFAADQLGALEADLSGIDMHRFLHRLRLRLAGQKKS